MAGDMTVEVKLTAKDGQGKVTAEGGFTVYQMDLEDVLRLEIAMSEAKTAMLKEQLAAQK